MSSGDAIQVGIHLPQAGPAASPESLRRAAVQAEQLGFSDIWVSDHVAIPRNAPYPPSKYIYEPLTALTWAAAATERIRLGTTVLVVPLRQPVLLAKILASLDLLSGGRLIIGAACGWLREEFDALGVPYEKRGPWTDESLDLIRRCWEDDPIDFDGSVTGAHLVDIRTKPQPARRIPIWNERSIRSPTVEQCLRMGIPVGLPSLRKDQVHDVVGVPFGKRGPIFVGDDVVRWGDEIAQLSKIRISLRTERRHQRNLHSGPFPVHGGAASNAS